MVAGGAEELRLYLFLVSALTIFPAYHRYLMQERNSTSLVIYSYSHPSGIAFFYEVLLLAPSSSIPSHPATFPAISSALPYPSLCGSRLAEAAFMASTPACLSSEADWFQSEEPVTAPTAL